MRCNLLTFFIYETLNRLMARSIHFSKLGLCLSENINVERGTKSTESSEAIRFHVDLKDENL